MWAALSLLVLWLAAIAAYAYEDGMNLFQWMGRFSQVLERPFAIGWTAHTPKFMLVSLIIYAFGIALYYSGRENRRPGEEYGSAKWGSPKELNRKYMDHQHKDANGDVQKFPSFEGKDLDGNEVKSDELFSANAVTVVNFWFTTCSPCVGELGDLDALNKELAEKGGALIGVNTFTLDGDEAAISEAKDVLAKKGAAYQNVYFDSDGEAGKFTANIFAYPTTYVIDRNGNIVGEPIVGAITEQKQAETLQKLIDQALAADMG